MTKDIKNPVLQPKEDMCLTASIKNILTELGGRHKNNALKTISLKSINKICQYQDGIGTASDIAVANMRAHLSKQGYELIEEFGPKRNIERLKNIIASDSSSLPIVSLAPEYFTTQRGSYDVPEIPDVWDHIVIIVNVTDTAVTIFDPLEAFIKKSTRNSLKKDINMVNFIRYWGMATPPNQTIYVEKKAKSQKLLSHFGE